MNKREREQYLREYYILKTEGKPFFPYAVFKDSAMAAIVLLVIVLLAIFLGAEIGPKADPTTTTYTPRPEWYFFFLFELLRVVKPPALVFIATIGIPTVCLVLLILLWLLLGSWAAPLYLVGSSLLVVAAALGITVYVFQDLLGYGELAFIVPVAASILLLALGADYNVFLISRIWGEAGRSPLKPAIRSAGASAGRAITVAGLILALSFAAVMLIPIQSFREIGFALFIGLLLDTLVARTLLIPARVALFGLPHEADQTSTGPN